MAIDFEIDFLNWVRSHRLAVAAWILQHRGADQEWRFIAQLQLCESFGQSEFINLPFLNSLSAYTLELLVMLLPLQTPAYLRRLKCVDEESGKILNFQETVKRALYEKTSINFRRTGSTNLHKAYPARSRGARLLAEYMLSNHGDLDIVASIAERYVSPSWRFLTTTTSFGRALSQAVATGLPILRSPTSTYDDKIEVLKLMSLPFRQQYEESSWIYKNRGSLYWNEILFHLLNGIHIWPLVVFRGKTSPNLIGMGLPFGLSTTGGGDRRRVSVVGAKGVILDGWSRSLSRSAEAAVDLYRMERSAQRDDWLDRVERTGFVLDGRATSAVFKPFAAATYPDLTASGRSLEAYACATMVSRLMGSTDSFPIAVLGMIGDRVDEARRSRNRAIELPAHCVAKLRWIDSTRQVHKVVLAGSIDHPEISAIDDYLTSNTRRGAQVVRVHTLSRVMDSSLSRDWRHYVFRRCPDLMHSIFDNNQAIIADADLSEFRTFLGGSSRSVLYLPPSISPRAIAMALHRLNTEWREDQSPTPKRLWFSFIRHTIHEHDDQFLAVIVQAMGVPPSQVRNLMNAPSVTKAQTIFASMINTLSGSEESPAFRAPDVLVLVVPRPPKATLSFIFGSALDERLDAIRDAAWSSVLGRLRIIIVEDQGVAPELPVPDVQNLTDAENFLSTFRFEFSRQAATLVVNDEEYRGTKISSLLGSMTDKGILKLAGHKYFMPTPVRTLSSRIAPKHLAQMHWRAAIAQAPFVAIERLPGETESEALRLDAIQEAQFHIGEALRLEPSSPDASLWRATLMQLSSRYDTPTWDAIHAAAAEDRFNRLDLLQTAISYIHKRRAKSEPVRSLELVSVLKLLIRAVDNTKGAFLWIPSPNEQLPYQTQRVEEVLATEVANLAQDISSLLIVEPNEDDIYLASFWSWINSNFLGKETTVPKPTVQHIDDIIKELIRSQPALANKIWAQWVENVGRNSPSPEERLWLYELGTSAHPGYVQLWLRSLYAADNYDLDMSSIYARLAEFKRTEPYLYRSMLQWGNKMDGRRLEPDIRAGWQHFIEWAEEEKNREFTRLRRY